MYSCSAKQRHIGCSQAVALAIALYGVVARIVPGWIRHTDTIELVKHKIRDIVGRGC